MQGASSISAQKKPNSCIELSDQVSHASSTAQRFSSTSNYVKEDYEVSAKNHRRSTKYLLPPDGMGYAAGQQNESRCWYHKLQVRSRQGEVLPRLLSFPKFSRGFWALVRGERMLPILPSFSSNSFVAGRSFWVISPWNFNSIRCDLPRKVTLCSPRLEIPLSAALITLPRLHQQR